MFPFPWYKGWYATQDFHGNSRIQLRIKHINDKNELVSGLLVD